MLFKSPGALAFSLGNIDIYWYGILMSLSILAGITAVGFIAKKFFKEISFDEICDISFLLIIAGIIGARLYYVFADYGYFLKHPLKVLAIRDGGISIHGAILGGVIAGFFYCMSRKKEFLKYADLFVFGLLTGQIIGRWCNFFNSEAFGLPCDLPWKLYIPFQYRPLIYRENEFFHPAFLYESLLNIAVFAILFFILKKFPKRANGLIFFLYILFYSVVRLFTESIRIDSVMNIGVLHIAHIVSLVLIVFALFGILCTIKVEKE